MRWTEIAERIGLQNEVVQRLRECESTFDRESFQADISALSDPERTAEANQTLLKKLSPDEGNVKMELCQLHIVQELEQFQLGIILMK